MGSFRLRKGMIVAVTFYDHCEDSDKPIDFIIYGELVEVNRKYLVIQSWTYANPKTARDDNVKFWTIIRSTISKVTVLVPKE